MASLTLKAATVSILLLLLVLAAVNVTAFALFGFQRDLLLVSLIALAIATALSIISASRLMRPIRELAPTIDADGRLEFRSTKRETQTPEELEAVTQAIAQIAERQQRDAEARQRLERVRSEFLANVSHELRTPIFAVQGFIETLLDGALDDPEVNRDFLERARVQSERLNNLLNDLIDISRIESGEMRMSFRMFDLQSFLREFTSEMQPAAETKKIDLYFTGNVLPHREVEVFADRERIKQVLINLVDNAIKYSNGGGFVKVELVDLEPDAHHVTVRVSDSGIGIPPEHLPRLFERFYRVNKDRARSQPGGTGLGLAIVKHIVEGHRGKINVTSELGKGSVFQFTLCKDPF